MGKYLCEEDMSTGEYISRDEALKIFHQCCDNCTSSYNGVMCRACADADAMDILIDIPAADVQPVRFARWINLDNRILCSGCGAGYDDYDEVKQNTYIFCPNCGARIVRDMNEISLL